MTHPDPALNELPADTAAASPAATVEEGILSVNPVLRAAQEAVREGVDRHVKIKQAIAEVRNHVGFVFRMEAMLTLILGERKEKTVRDAAGMSAALNLLREEAGKRFDTPDDSVAYDSQKAA